MRQEQAIPRQTGTVRSERLRVLREIHDGIGPILTGMALGLRAVRNLSGRDEKSAARLLAQLEDELQGAIAELRRLTDEIRPNALHQLDLIEAIRLHAMALSSRVSGAGGEQLRIEVHTRGDLSSLTPRVRMAVYRIICEALTNTAKHSHARSCVVSIRLDGDLEVEVVDDGIGIPGGAAPPWSGIGLRSMRDRAVELGGEWAVEPGARGGTRIAATFPVHGN
ncbi:MAG TPA: histidine kinase [Actinophytocola sp.]|uniref:sensor histidine kinase n=1 Tax=Actinophytocola sp. TaxID=1872138 RepID=UPI002DDD76DA|nr:histidine kinase [Actinophytocola sp.]HEV2778474.1 histidine kinase [Actinophytocola sp.]